MTASPSAANPPATSPGRLLVLAAGLATTALALAGVHVLNQSSNDFQIMGWYANYVIPVGALLVGAIASSGYALGSWLRGVKVCGGLLAGIVVFQIAAYFGGQYLEFASLGLLYDDGTAVGFLHYFDFATRSFAWTQDDGTAGSAFGAWGYGMRALEVMGFAAGSLIAPAALRGKPYCESCAVYMRKQHTAWIPASIPAERIRKKHTEQREEHDRAQQEALEGALGQTESLAQLAQAGDSNAFRALVTELSDDPKATEKLPARVTAELFQCGACESGEAKLTLRNGQGQNVEQNELARVALPQHFVRAVLQSQT